MKDLEYIYLETNLFENRKIKLIHKMPNGDIYFVFWIQLLCLAGKTNHNGWVMLTENRDYTTKELSIISEIPETILEDALEVFVELRMIRRFGDRILIQNWTKYQYRMDKEVEE